MPPFDNEKISVSIKLSSEQLLFIIERIDLLSIKRKKRYSVIE